MAIFDFIMTYDFDRPAEEILCDLINIANGYKLYPSVAQFGSPSELDPRHDIEDDPNTYIPAVVSQSFDQRMVPEETGFLYTRLPLAILRITENSTIAPPAIPFSTYDILDQINLQLKTQLTQDDLEDTQYTTLDGDFIIRAKSTSKVWIGERLITVEGGGNKLLLFPNYFLPGFSTPTEVLADKKSQLSGMANTLNGTAWRELFDFEIDQMETDMVGAVGRNTRVYVKTYVVDHIDQWLYYSRVNPTHINDQFAGTVVPSVPVPTVAFTTYSVLAQINATLNLHLTPDDVENTGYLPGLAQYQITFKTNSLGWLPGVYLMNAHPDVPQMNNLRVIGDGTSYRIRGDGVYATYQ